MAQNLPKKIYITKLRQQEEEAKNWIIPSPCSSLTSDGEDPGSSSGSTCDMGRTAQSPATPESLDSDIPSVSSEPWDRLIESIDSPRHQGYSGIPDKGKERNGKPRNQRWDHGNIAFKVPGKENIVGKAFKSPKSPANTAGHDKGKAAYEDFNGDSPSTGLGSCNNYKAVGGRCAGKFESYLKLENKGLFANPFENNLQSDSQCSSNYRQHIQVCGSEGSCHVYNPADVASPRRQLPHDVPLACSSKQSSEETCEQPKSPSVARPAYLPHGKLSPRHTPPNSPAGVFGDELWFSPSSLSSLGSSVRSPWMRDFLPCSPLSHILSPSALLDSGSPQILNDGHPEENAEEHLHKPSHAAVDLDKAGQFLPTRRQSSATNARVTRHDSFNDVHASDHASPQSSFFGEHREYSTCRSVSEQNNRDIVSYGHTNKLLPQPISVTNQILAQENVDLGLRKSSGVQFGDKLSSDQNYVEHVKSERQEDHCAVLSGHKNVSVEHTLDAYRISKERDLELCEPLDFSSAHLENADENDCDNIDFPASPWESLLAFGDDMSSPHVNFYNKTEKKVQVQSHELMSASFRYNILWSHASHEMRKLTREQTKQMVPMPPSPCSPARANFPGNLDRVDGAVCWGDTPKFNNQKSASARSHLHDSHGLQDPPSHLHYVSRDSFQSEDVPVSWYQQGQVHSTCSEKQGNDFKSPGSYNQLQHRHDMGEFENRNVHNTSPTSSLHSACSGDIVVNQERRSVTNDTVGCSWILPEKRPFKDSKCSPVAIQVADTTDDFVEEEKAGAGKCLPPCQICGDSSVGYHCGAHICEACKKFYLRCMKNNSSVAFKCVRKGSCLITKENRSQCQYCRFMKCKLLAMYLPGTDKARELRVDFKTIPCRVCAACSSGYHFGAITCEGCKGFFRRMAREKAQKDYLCLHGGNCDINTATRTLCRHCRYRKCLQVGMTLDGSRMGRQSNSRKRATVLQLQRGDVPTTEIQPKVVKTESPAELPSCRSQHHHPIRTVKGELDAMSASTCASSVENPVSSNSGNPHLARQLPNCPTSYSGHFQPSHPMYPQRDLTFPWPSLPSFTGAQHELRPNFATGSHPNIQRFASSGHASGHLSGPPTYGPFQNNVYDKYRMNSGPPHCRVLSPRMFDDKFHMPLMNNTAENMSCRRDVAPRMQIPQSYPTSPRQGRVTHGPSEIVSVSNEKAMNHCSSRTGVCSVTLAKSPHKHQNLQHEPWKENHPVHHGTLRQTSDTVLASVSYQKGQTKGQLELASKPSQPLSITSMLNAQTPSDKNRTNQAQFLQSSTCSSSAARSKPLPPDITSESDSYVSDSEDDYPASEEYKNFAAQIVDCLEILQDLDLRPPQLDKCVLDPNDLTSIWRLPTIAFQHYTKVIIRFCHYLPGLKDICSKDCMTLLRSALYPITLLHHSQKYNVETGEYNFFINTSTEKELILQYFPHFRPMETHFQEIGHAVKSLNLTQEEYALLIMLTIFSTDELSRAPLSDPSVVSKLQDQAMAGLEYFCARHKDLNRFGMLLLRLSELQRANDEHAQAIVQAQKDFPQVNFGDIWNEVVLWKPLGKNQSCA